MESIKPGTPETATSHMRAVASNLKDDETDINIHNDYSNKLFKSN